MAGKKVVIVTTGGNIAPEVLVEHFKVNEENELKQ